MGLAEDLLAQATHLATYQGLNVSQAALRRSISTAYYALFHLLVAETADRWQGSPAGVTGVQRALNHASMKNSSLAFAKSDWTDWHGIEHSVPPALRNVAEAFAGLQEERHTADYDNHETWSITEVQAILKTAEGAFHNWQSIRNDPMSGNYLLLMLVGKKR